MSTPEKEPIPEGQTPEQAAHYYVKYGEKIKTLTAAKYAAFKEGISWAHRHLSSQPSPGLQWVKASERLPADADWYTPILVRFRGDEKDEWRASYIDVNEVKHILPHYYRVEWLEETPSVQPIEGEGILPHISGNVPNQEGISPTWLKIWSEVENWYGDLKKRESGRDLLLRLQREYTLPSAPEAQPIADKEVPEDLKQMADSIAEEVCPHEGYGVTRKECEKSSNWLDFMEGARCGAVAMYHKMQEEIKDADETCRDVLKGNYITNYNKLRKELATTRTEISTQAIQIEGLLASNKEWGEKYLLLYKELSDALNRITRLGYTKGYLPGDDDFVRKATELLNKYPSPTHTDKS